jgi:hypothetical protein
LHTHTKPQVKLTDSTLGRFLLEELIGAQLANKFPDFYGTQRYITMFTSCSFAYFKLKVYRGTCPNLINYTSVLLFCLLRTAGEIKYVTGLV